MGIAARVLSITALLVVVVLMVRLAGKSSPEMELVVPGSDTAEMLVRMHEENGRLNGQVSNLMEQVVALELKLAETRVKADLELVKGPEKSRPPEARLPAEVVTDPARLQIVEVNREMMVAVISGGSRAGMKPGMLFSVIRNNEVLAVIRVSEVRERVAGGLIEWNGKRAFPEIGDRLVLRSTQDG